MIEQSPIMDAVILTAMRVSSMACERIDIFEKEVRDFVFRQEFFDRNHLGDDMFELEGRKFFYKEYHFRVKDEEAEDEDDELADLLDDITGLDIIHFQWEGKGPVYFGSVDPADLIDLIDVQECGVAKELTHMDVILTECGFIFDYNEHILFPQEDAAIEESPDSKTD